jgi:hypothetical protein
MMIVKGYKRRSVPGMKPVTFRMRRKVDVDVYVYPYTSSNCRHFDTCLVKTDRCWTCWWMDGLTYASAEGLYTGNYLDKLELFFVSFSVLDVVGVKLTVFRNVTPCSLIVSNLCQEGVTFVFLSLSTGYKLHRI